MSSRLVASIILGAFFFNTGVFPVRLVIKTTADELPADYEFKAPQTVNIQSNESKNFDGYDNLIKVEIPEDKQIETTGDNTEIASNSNKLSIQTGVQPDWQNEVSVINTTVPASISNLIEEYKQKILLALNSKNSESALKTILANAYPAIKETIQNAYASAAEPWRRGTRQPFSSSVMALFNNTNYLGLRRNAEDKKAKDKEKARNKLIDQNNKLKTTLANTLKTIKEKFRKQKLATLNRLTNLKNSQEQNINSLTSQIKSIPQKLVGLKQQLQDKLKQINYFKNKENEYRGKYTAYDRERKHNKDKYKKYKKKYKKKHKSKYKKKYKKYKKRYKKAKSKRDSARKTYSTYEAQKNQAYQDYLNLQKQLQSYNNKEIVLTEELSLARSENEKTKTLLNEKTESALGGPASWEESINNDQNYQLETNQALANFNTSKKRLEDDYNNEVNQAEKTYQSNLEKAETYKLVMDQIQNTTKYQVEETIAMGQERVQQEVVFRKWVTKETISQKQLAEKRVEDRNNLAKEVATTVFTGMIKGSKDLLNSFNVKMAQLKKELKKISKKVKDFKETYEETKDYKKKMKKYKKKYEKYSKKAKKSHGKKRRKYEGKKSSAFKKYLKYKKKYDKYNGLKKAYKSGYKQAKDIYNQFKDQYQDLEKQRNDLQKSYNESVTQATSFRDGLLKQSEQEYNYSKSQLQLAETMEDYSNIGLDNQGRDKNEDLKAYLALIPEASTYSLGGLASLSFQGGLDAVASIKKSFKKLRHNAKKAYKKYLKKLKKQQEEQARKIAEQNAARARQQAYYRRLANQRVEEARQAEKARQDSFLKQQINQFLGFGYNPNLKQDRTIFGNTNISLTNYSYKNIQPLAMPNGFKINPEDVIPTYELKKDTIWQSVTKWYNNSKDEQNKNFKEALEELKLQEQEIKEKRIKNQLDRERAKQLLPQEAWDYADLADNSYLGQGGNETNSKGETQVRTSIPEGFERFTDLERYGLSIDELENKETGLRASFYIDKSTGDLVVVFAGTDMTSWQDKKTDGKQGLGMKTAQYEQVKALADKVKKRVTDRNVVAVGHSLGGGEAAYFGAIVKCKTITFNAAGVHNNTLERGNVTETEFSNITNYITKNEPLTVIQQGHVSLVSWIAPDALGKQVTHNGRYEDDSFSPYNADKHSNYHAKYTTW